MAEQRFDGNEFDGRKWKAKLFQKPNELEAYFNELQLVGRCIVAAKFIGFDFESRMDSDDDIHPAKTYSSNFAEIDDPFILTLDDGRRLDIAYEDGSTFRISINTLPLNLNSYNGFEPINGTIFFRNILGAKISKIIVNKSKEMPDFTWAYGIDIDLNQKEFIESVIFEMSNGYQIYLTSYIDYGHIYIEKIGQKRMEWKQNESWYWLDSKAKKNLQTPIVNMETCKVKYDNWEMQCCGKPFHTGSRVTWFGAKVTDSYLPDCEGLIDYHYQGHYSNEYVSIIKGVVKSITVRYCSYKENGSYRTRDKEKSVLVKSVDGWQEYKDGEWEAYEYIVELKNVTVQDTGYRLQ